MKFASFPPATVVAPAVDDVYDAARPAVARIGPYPVGGGSGSRARSPAVIRFVGGALTMRLPWLLPWLRL